MRTLLGDKRLEGAYLVYDRMSKRLSFSKRPKESRRNFLVGQVVGGEVAGRPVAYWMEKISRERRTNGNA